MQERQIIKCKVCTQLKVRLLDRKVGKDKIWVNDNGKAWNGKTCPECHIEFVRQKVREKRSSEK